MKKSAFLAAFLSLFIPLNTSRQRPAPQKNKPCRLCIMQRPSQLDYILRRAINQSDGPDENASFGHCFFCTQCPEDIIPSCWGWWPADPDGGDYDGDAGQLQPDRKEAWTTAACTSIDREKSRRSVDKLAVYEKEHTYQVLNQGGTSCLGFCRDIAEYANMETSMPWGNYTLAGDMEFPTAELFFYNPQQQTSDQLMYMLTEEANAPIHQGGLWESTTE